MPAGRPPKPSALHALEGTRNRRKNTEPKFSAAVTCPKHLDKAAKAEWKRISTELSAQGLLTSVDRAALAAYCACYSRWADAELNIQKFGVVIKSPKSGYPINSPYVSIANTALALMHKFATEFGFSPASRTKVNVTDAPTSGDPFAEFMSSLGANEIDVTTHADDTPTTIRATST